MIDRLSSVLGIPSAYRLFATIVGADRSRRIHLANYVKPMQGEKVLDIGCGPADVLASLPDVDYTGLDISPEYVAAAEMRFGHRGRFLRGDVELTHLEGEEGTFDLVMATGVVHHLDDDGAARLFELARSALNPRGRLVTFDGCYANPQSNIARWFLRQDRGAHVRTLPDYARLASTAFHTVETHLRHDLLRIPYTHLIMHCSGRSNTASMGAARTGPSEHGT